MMRLKEDIPTGSARRTKASLNLSLGSYERWATMRGHISGGKTRHVVEFAKSILRGVRIETEEQKRDYIRGYFDAEGSVPKIPRERLYIYFAQKNLRSQTSATLFRDLGYKMWENS